MSTERRRKNMWFCRWPNENWNERQYLGKNYTHTPSRRRLFIARVYKLQDIGAAVKKNILWTVKKGERERERTWERRKKRIKKKEPRMTPNVTLVCATWAMLEQGCREKKTKKKRKKFRREKNENDNFSVNVSAKQTLIGGNKPEWYTKMSENSSHATQEDKQAIRAVKKYAQKNLPAGSQLWLKQDKYGEREREREKKQRKMRKQRKNCILLFVWRLLNSPV